MRRVDERGRFERDLLPHLDAAYNLARWLARDDHDAEDLVQTAYVRALKSVGTFHGANARAWLLAIVRNVCFTWLQREKLRGPTASFDEETHGPRSDATDPELPLLREDQAELVRRAVEELPADLREVVVLRELEGLSYKEIAAVADIPLGTVMSRLARARERLRQRLGGCGEREA